MEDPYPTDEDLIRIAGWSYKDIPGLLDFVRSKWWAADWGWKQTGDSLSLSTGGWSGNEQLIDALRDTFFWSLCWKLTRRGGHYEFEIPKRSK